MRFELQRANKDGMRLEFQSFDDGVAKLRFCKSCLNRLFSWESIISKMGNDVSISELCKMM